MSPPHILGAEDSPHDAGGSDELKRGSHEIYVCVDTDCRFLDVCRRKGLAWQFDGLSGTMVHREGQPLFGNHHEQCGAGTPLLVLHSWWIDALALPPHTYISSIGVRV